MTGMTGTDVRTAAEASVRMLGPLTDRDWTTPAGDLDWSCWTTAAHIAHDLFAYAAQVTGRPDADYLPFDLQVHEDAGPARVLTIVTAAAGLLGAAVDTAGPDVRAWHWGPTDPGGFAAMGVAELVLHTYDITRGLGVAWRPPARLSAGVLARLFPEAPDGDPTDVLLWCTGRGELPGRPRRTSWGWHAARG